MGSVNVSENGRIKVIIAMSLAVICSPWISGSHFRSLRPVSLRRRRLRLYRMFAELVSGRQTISTMSAKPESQRSSQIGHFQPLCCAAKPPIKGPKTGPQIAASPQTAMAYALFAGRYISPKDAPPVARTGEPKNPVKNRNARSMPKFLA